MRYSLFVVVGVVNTMGRGACWGWAGEWEVAVSVKKDICCGVKGSCTLKLDLGLKDTSPSTCSISILSTRCTVWNLCLKFPNCEMAITELVTCSA